MSQPTEGVQASENIRVMARFRPLSDRESKENPDVQCVEFGADGRSCTLAVERSKTEHVFQFNRVFEPIASQEDVYEAAGRTIVESVIHGFNGAIIAYGQTGSGKTHTMMGPRGARSLIDGEFDDPELGIVPRALLELQAHAQRSEGAVQLRVAYVEIYQEHIIDLLTVVKSQKQPAALTMRGDVDRSLWLPEVTETPVQSAREAMEVMRTGNKRRTKASTEMNSDSSRSHAVFIVSVTNSIDPTKRKFAQLYLVDLAGSERTEKTEVWGKQLEEAKLINRSLLALGQVIWNLSIQAKHIPYRDSKLTRLLQNCLGGNARTCLVCTASPHPANAPESLSTLRFGDRASKIRNDARMNIALDAAELKRLLQKANAELTELRGAYLHLEGEHAAACAALADKRRGGAVPPGALSPMTSASVLAAQPGSDISFVVSSGGEETAASSQLILELIARRLFARDLLPSLVCPLTRAVMRDPVCAADGSTYERSAIGQLIRQAGRMPAMSPATGRPLQSKQLVANVVLRQLITRLMPDLPPLEGRISEFSLLSVYLIEHILSYVNGTSLGTSQVACRDFLAVGSKPALWEAVVVAELGINATEANVGGKVDPREQYVRKRMASLCATKSPVTSSGLRLFPPPKASH